MMYMASLSRAWETDCPDCASSSMVLRKSATATSVRNFVTSFRFGMLAENLSRFFVVSAPSPA